MNVDTLAQSAGISGDGSSLSGSAASPGALWQSVWRKVCFNVDGIAIGTTVAALASHGVLQALADAKAPVSIDTLARRFAARPGYLHLAMRLLAGQGFIHYEGHDFGQHRAALTADGTDWLAALPAYALMPELLDAASRLPAMITGKLPPASELIDILERGLHSPGLDGLPTGLRQRVRAHILGPGVAVSLHALVQAGIAGPPIEQPDGRITRSALPASGPASALALRLLAAQGWVARDGDAFFLTEEGILAAGIAAQYSMVLAYLPTFRKVPQLLFAHGPAARASAGAPDENLDRSLDIEISGDVFSRHCRLPLLDVALPLFNREALAKQPLAIVDTGCGDGTMLLETVLAIREHSLRGRSLDAHPLLAVGADTSPIARRVTAERLARAGVPHLVVHGDIAAPGQLAAELASHGVDMREALHMCKSVIHNRVYQPPQDTAAAATRRPCSEALFVAQDGTLVAPQLMEQNLMEHFRAWLPWTRRHGMIVIEAHAVAPEITCAHLGKSVITMLQASHGYSRQNLIEADCHRALAREAGFIRLASRDLLAAGGQALLTLDYMLPLEAIGLLGELPN